MKKLIYCALALAAGLFASSCQQENLEPVQSSSTVTFSVEIPEAVATKAGAVGNAANMINDLVYAVYVTTAESVKAATDNWEETTKLLYDFNSASPRFVNGRDVVSLDLLNNQNHIVLLWAQHDDIWIDGETFDLTNVTYPESFAVSSDVNDKYAAFYGVKFISKDDRKPGSVTLVRPFAQINLASSDPIKYDDVTVTKTVVNISKAGAAFNIATEEATGEANISYNWDGKVYSYPFTANSVDYDHYLAMSYVFAGGNVDVEYTVDTDYGTGISGNIPNIPVKKNYRTNVIGSLLTSNINYSVELDKKWGNAGKEMEAISDGIIKNINGDYEVANEIGLAYAINNLFEQGGNFYLTNELYEMAGYDVTAPSVPEDIVLNIYGDVPVVTRAATLNVTITGLKSALIDTNNGTVSFSGIKVEGTDENSETPAFIETNNGNADFTSCKTTNQDYIGENTGTVTESNSTTIEGNDIVADEKGETLKKVATADELVEELAAGNNVIFTNDIELAANLSNAYGKTGINITVGQTIDGNNHTLTVTGAGGTWDSAISTTGGTIKNINITSGFRGIFVNHNSKYSEPVILEKVTINGPTYTISCDQGMAQNLIATDCVINGWTSYAKTIGNVSFTNCSFGKGAGYQFARPYAPTTFVNCDFSEGYEVDARDAVTFKNCRLNGVALTDANLEDLVKGNIANAGADTVVSTADEFVAALEANKNVFFANDIKIEPAKMSNAYGTTGVNVYAGQTIDGNNYKLDVKGAGGTWDSGICTSGGVIKNLWVTGSFRGIFVKGADHIEKIVLENVRVEGTTYTISIDQASEQGLEATNSIFRGWTSYAGTIGNVKFTNCTFGAGNGYNFSRPYAPTQYVNCKFEAGHQIDPQAAVSFENCTLDGVALTAENLSTLVISNISKATLVTSEGEVEFASTTKDLQIALAEGKKVVLANDLTITADEGITAPYGNKTALSQKGGVFNGNGKTITADLPGDNYIYMTNGGTTKNLNITGAFRGVMIMSPTQTVYLENVVSGGKGVVYAFNTGEGDSTQDVVATNCTFNGWSSWSEIKSATFTSCTFGQGSEYSSVTGRIGRPYVNTLFDGCSFCSKYYIDLSALKADQTVTIKNCTVNGVKITAENWTSLVAPEDTCGEGQISVELKDGSFLTADNVADYIVFE